MGTIAAAASQLDVPLASQDGSTRVSGHTLRVTGAQGLTRLRYPLWAVQLLGRWGTDAVKGYVGASALEVFTESGPAAGVDPESLEAVVAVAGRSHQPPRQTPARPTAAPLDRTAVELLVARTAGDLKDELSDALMSEVRAEIARLAPPAPPTTRDQACTTDPQLVINTRTECVHHIAVGPGSAEPARLWQSPCGWAFGRWGGFELLSGAHHAVTCERCLKKAAEAGQ